MSHQLYDVQRWMQLDGERYISCDVINLMISSRIPAEFFPNVTNESDERELYVDRSQGRFRFASAIHGSCVSHRDIFSFREMPSN